MSGKRVRALGVVAVVLVAAGGLGALLLTRDATEAQPATVVVGDFESGSLEGWRAVGGGAGGWLVYTDGQKAPDPARSDPNMPFNVADPPRGKFAVVSDMNGPGTQILFRDVRLDGRFRLDMIVFYFGSVPFSTPGTLAFDAPEPNQQFRIDLVRPSAPIDSLEKADVLASLFRTSTDDLPALQPASLSFDVSRLAGQTVRLRLAVADNGGPLRAGVDEISFERLGPEGDRVELLSTPEAASALNLVLRRMTESDALAAVSARAAEMTRALDANSSTLLAALSSKSQEFTGEVQRATQQAVSAIESKGFDFTRTMLDNSNELARVINDASEAATARVNQTMQNLQYTTREAIEESQRVTAESVEMAITTARDAL